MCGDLHRLFADAPRRQRRGITGHDRTAAGEGAYAVGNAVSIAADDVDRASWNTQLVTDHLRQRAGQALADLDRPRYHHNSAVAADPHVGALVGAGAGDLRVDG